MILFIKNITIEGPGTLGDFFYSRGIETKTIDLYQGDALPQDVSACRAVVCLGGPMNVYQEEEYPFLKKENAFIREAVKKQIPFLGICLGAQLLAKACGAEVTKAPHKEIGFSDVRLTTFGQKDPLFQGLERFLTVYQWHEDTFDIPERGFLLASSDQCVHQAFRFGRYAYGLQFHLEITDQNIREWAQRYFPKADQESLAMTEQMIASYGRRKEKFKKQAILVYNNFLQLIERKDRECCASR